VITPWTRPAARRYEKYDSLGATREKTDDPFTDELNMVLDKVQDLQLVRSGAWTQLWAAGSAGAAHSAAARAVAGCRVNDWQWCMCSVPSDCKWCMFACLAVVHDVLIAVNVRTGTPFPT